MAYGNNNYGNKGGNGGYKGKGGYNNNKGGYNNKGGGYKGGNKGGKKDFVEVKTVLNVPQLRLNSNPDNPMDGASAWIEIYGVHPRLAMFPGDGNSKPIRGRMDLVTTMSFLQGIESVAKDEEPYWITELKAGRPNEKHPSANIKVYKDEQGVILIEMISLEDNNRMGTVPVLSSDYATYKDDKGNPLPIDKASKRHALAYAASLKLVVTSIASVVAKMFPANGTEPSAENLGMGNPDNGGGGYNNNKGGGYKGGNNNRGGGNGYKGNNNNYGGGGNNSQWDDSADDIPM